jgi:hypothetical protein
MASSSTHHGIGDAGGELKHLMTLFQSGVMNTAEFLKMSRDITETNRINSGAHGSDEDKESDEHSLPDSALVGEDGNLLSPARTPCSSPVQSGSGPSQHDSEILSTSPPRQAGESRKLHPPTVLP